MKLFTFYNVYRLMTTNDKKREQARKRAQRLRDNRKNQWRDQFSSPIK